MLLSAIDINLSCLHQIIAFSTANSSESGRRRPSSKARRSSKEMGSCARDPSIYHSRKDKEDISEALTYEPRILNYITYKSKLPLRETYTWTESWRIMVLFICGDLMGGRGPRINTDKTAEEGLTTLNQPTCFIWQQSLSYNSDN